VNHQLSRANLGHHGTAHEVQAQRKQTLDAAYATNPSQEGVSNCLTGSGLRRFFRFAIRRGMALSGPKTTQGVRALRLPDEGGVTRGPDDVLGPP